LIFGQLVFSVRYAQSGAQFGRDLFGLVFSGTFAGFLEKPVVVPLSLEPEFGPCAKLLRNVFRGIRDILDRIHLA
jgi:hypothetical protein